MSTLNVDKVDPSTGTALEIGTSGDTITVPSGATLAVAGTLNPSGTITAGTIAGTALAASTVTPDKTSGVVRPNANPYIINGNFDVWQRGTSFTTSVYTADRWLQDLSGATATVTREAHTVGQTDVPGNPKYYLKQDVTTGDANGGMLYRIEDVDTLTGAFTLSFYAKGVNPDGGNLDIVIQQNFGSGGSGTVSLSEQDLTLTGSWVKYVFTGTLASISGKTVGTSSYIQIIIKQPSDDAATDAWNLQISQVQLEAGTYTSSTIPPFQHESYGDNLARCHRYYITYGYVGSVQDGYAGRAYSGTAIVWAVPLPRPLRASPDVTLTGTLRAFGYNATFDSTTAFGVYSYGNTNSSMITLNSTGFSGLANDTIYNVVPINDCLITLDAEL